MKIKTWFLLWDINEISISRDKKKEKYQLGDYKLIQYQILWTNIMRIVWQPVGRITTEILEVKGLKVHKTIIYYKISVH